MVVARSSERVKLSGLTGANRVEEGWSATARGESQSGNRVLLPRKRIENEKGGGLELWWASKRGKKNREERGKEEIIKGRRIGGGEGVAAVPLYSKYLHLGDASPWKN